MPASAMGTHGLRSPARSIAPSWMMGTHGLRRPARSIAPSWMMGTHGLRSPARSIAPSWMTSAPCPACGGAIMVTTPRSSWQRRSVPSSQARNSSTVQSRSAASGIERFPLPPRRKGRLVGRGLEPHRRIVENGATARQARLGAGQEVDADALVPVAVRPDALDHDRGRVLAGTRLGVEQHRALLVAEPDRVAVLETELGHGLGVEEGGRPLL